MSMRDDAQGERSNCQSAQNVLPLGRDSGQCAPSPHREPLVSSHEHPVSENVEPLGNVPGKL